MPAAVIRIAILISGRGSNMLRLVDSISPDLACEIALVAANAPCAGLLAADDRGLKTALIDRSLYASKADHEAELAAAIENAKADWIFLAGYMAVLSPAFVEKFSHHIINIHPSLLPRFKGLDTHSRALAASALRHGASVHMVTAALDDGAVILQAGLDVGENDDADQLAARVLRLEHALYPFVLESLASGALSVSGGLPVWHDGPTALMRCAREIQSVLADSVIWPDQSM